MPNRLPRQGDIIRIWDKDPDAGYLTYVGEVLDRIPYGGRAAVEIKDLEAQDDTDQGVTLTIAMDDTTCWEFGSMQFVPHPPDEF